MFCPQKESKVSKEGIKSAESRGFTLRAWPTQTNLDSIGGPGETFNYIVTFVAVKGM